MEKLSEMARTPMNEHCSAVILNKLPRKLGDLEKFLIPCEFPGMDECLALADLGASINIMPLSVWEAFSLPELTPTCMTLELADRSVSKPIGIAKDISFKTSQALIDVHKGELTLCIGNKAIPYNLDQTDYPDCEVFRALSSLFTRASHPQLHFGNGYSRNGQKPSQKRQNQTQSGKDWKRQSHSKPKVKSQSPRSTKVNPRKVKVNSRKVKVNPRNVKVNPDKAKAEK
nr:reverse transcriptase domain-containing protein [Tanacetum cinerariifolium]